MHDFPPNIDWRLTTFLATALGYFICDDFNAIEQFAIGNWIIQIGQTIITNASYQHLIEERITEGKKINLNGRTFKSGGSPFFTSKPPHDFKKFYDTFKSDVTNNQIEILQKAIQRINEKLEELVKEMN